MTAQLAIAGLSSADVARAATFSPDGRYRYCLERQWDHTFPHQLPTATFLLLNPSKADDQKDDPTTAGLIRKCRRLGFGGFRIVNLFAFVATDAGDLVDVPDPVGPVNDRAILNAATAPGAIVVCGWGVGARRGHALKKLIQARAHSVDVLRLLGNAPLHAFGVTRDGNPGHPLFLPDAAKLVRWP
jgi:hypothetical protein